MQPEQKKLLFDIHQAIITIEEYIGIPQKYERYDNDQMLQDAVERNLEIIGEAMNKLIKIDNTIAIRNARRIVDLRNLLIHGYDSIDNAQVWAIIVNHIPELKEDVAKFKF